MNVYSTHAGTAFETTDVAWDAELRQSTWTSYVTLPDGYFTAARPRVHTIKCGSCRQLHGSAAEVRQCYTAARGGYLSDRDFYDQQQREIWAESAWLRAAEAGTPGTWREEELERMAESSGLPIPPGYF